MVVRVDNSGDDCVERDLEDGTQAFLALLAGDHLNLEAQ